VAGVALITGGHRGIGLGIARALDAAGWRIAIASELPEDHAEVVEARAALPAARYHRLDVASPADHDTVLERIEGTLGRVTTLVSNAGVAAQARGDLLEVSADSFDRCMDVNARGAFFLAQAVARRMLASPDDAGGPRSLIFVTSVSASMASITRGEYCVSKAAAGMVAQLFALRLAPHGIAVYDLRPGIIETAMTAGVRTAYDDRIAGGLVPAGRWGTPDDIARAVLPLARGDLAFATGSVIALDGALSVARL